MKKQESEAGNLWSKLLYSSSESISNFCKEWSINSKISCQEKLWFHNNVLLAVNLFVISAMSGELSKVFRLKKSQRKMIR